MAAEETPHFSAWFANDGGPLLVLPRELLGYWEGGDPPSGGRIIETPRWSSTPFNGTDYARACSAQPSDADSMFAVLDVGPGPGLVIGSEADAQGLYWLRYPWQSGAFLIVPAYGEEDADSLLATAVRQLPEESWQTLYPAFRTESGDLVLFHAACAGDEIDEYVGEQCAVIGDSITCHVAPGVYALEARGVDVATEPGPSRFVLCRFRPVG